MINFKKIPLILIIMTESLDKKVTKAYKGKIDQESKILLPKEFVDICPSSEVYIFFLVDEFYFRIYNNYDRLKSAIEEQINNKVKEGKNKVDMEREFWGNTRFAKIYQRNGIQIPKGYTYEKIDKKALLIPNEYYVCWIIGKGKLGMANISLFEKLHRNKYGERIQFNYTTL
jgi:DNA-binding transcriptional regulator/RsmH inhibitor MraZ